MSDVILTEQQILEQCIEDCFEGYKELVKELGDIFWDGGIFMRPNLYDMTTKKYNEKLNLAEFLQWGRRNPSRFIEVVFGVQLMDYQRYLIDSSWTKPFVAWAMSRNGGKSVLAALFIMAKMLLIPGFKAYILAGVGSQSIELFTKMEQFAMKNIASFTNLNDIFQSNVVKSQANSTGWVHNPASYTVRTYGGSQCFTLNGAFDNNRSEYKLFKFIMTIKSVLEEEIMNQRRWNQDEIDYLMKNYTNTSYEEMSIALGRTVSSIMHKAQNLNIQKPRIWTDEEINFLINNYQTKTYKELAERLGRTKSAVDLKINQLGLHKGIYTYDHSYFHNIDTEEKAYWLGFIYADGGIRNDIGESYQLVISLTASDGEHLKKFNKSLGGNLQVVYSDSLYKPNGKTYKKATIRVCSKEIVKDLVAIGATPCKSLTIQFPELRQDLIRHFIRGYFDGDGCVSAPKRKKERLSYIRVSFVSGSSEFLDDLRRILYENNIHSYFSKNEQTYRELTIGAMKDVDMFLHYIYDGATIYLDRKYVKKEKLYEHLNIEQRLLRHSEISGSFISEKENGNPEMEIRVEGCI